MTEPPHAEHLLASITFRLVNSNYIQHTETRAQSAAAQHNDCITMHPRVV